MPLEEYHKAMRQGLKEEKEAIARGEEPGLRVLPENSDTLAVRRESLGVVEIPSELIDGTCNDLRKNAFSRGFYPVSRRRVSLPTSGLTYARLTWRRASGTPSRRWSTSTTFTWWRATSG